MSDETEEHQAWRGETNELLRQLRSAFTSPAGESNAADLIGSLQAENKLQAQRIEELTEQVELLNAESDMMAAEIGDWINDPESPEEKGADVFKRLAKAVTKLDKENATLRATTELVERALRDYVLAQSRMADDKWSEGDDGVKRQLWKNLHACEDAGREALAALGAGG